jgi:DNA repair exonuclease SbcCD ATPase subunit
MNKKVIAISVVAAAGILSGFIYYSYRQQQTIDILTEQFAIEKEELQDEYSQLAIQYEGYKLTVNNDSLEQKLEDQRIKMQRLVEELKQTKAEDARRISELKKELATVRSVLRYYITQVDSLNKVNEQLTAENETIRQQYSSATRNNAALQQRNEQLNKKVTLAAHLEATGLRATALTSHDKETTSLRKVKSLRVDFSIAKNVTAEIGVKQVYVRILKPSEEVMTNAKSGRFSYDGSQIEYSMMKEIEYGGEETPVTLYWNRAETLDPGNYTFEVYADGNLIGRTTLNLKK